MRYRYEDIYIHMNQSIILLSSLPDFRGPVFQPRMDLSSTGRPMTNIEPWASETSATWKVTKCSHKSYLQICTHV